MRNLFSLGALGDGVNTQNVLLSDVAVVLDVLLFAKTVRRRLLLRMVI